MPLTSTQSNHHIRNEAVGRYLDTGTAAAFKITTGLQPRYVRVVNVAGLKTSRDFESSSSSGIEIPSDSLIPNMMV